MGSEMCIRDRCVSMHASRAFHTPVRNLEPGSINCGWFQTLVSSNKKRKIKGVLQRCMSTQTRYEHEISGFSKLNKVFIHPFCQALDSVEAHTDVIMTKMIMTMTTKRARIIMSMMEQLAHGTRTRERSLSLSLSHTHTLSLSPSLCVIKF